MKSLHFFDIVALLNSILYSTSRYSSTSRGRGSIRSAFLKKKLVEIKAQQLFLQQAETDIL